MDIFITLEMVLRGVNGKFINHTTSTTTLARKIRHKTDVKDFELYRDSVNSHRVFSWDRSYLLLEAFGIDSREGMDPLNKFWYGRKKRDGKILKKWSK